MAELVAKSPCDGLLPLTLGRVTASEADLGTLTMVLPYRGRQKALSQALQAAHGMAFPAPNRATGKVGARALWFGREGALLAGPDPDPALAEHAALSDQSDAWAAVRLEVAGGRVSAAALSLGACGPVATRLPGIEAALAGRDATPEALAAAVTDAAVAEAVSPIDDIRADAAYRRRAAAEILRRALVAALEPFAASRETAA